MVSVQVWGTWGRQFESGLPDDLVKSKLLLSNDLLFFIANCDLPCVASVLQNLDTSQQDAITRPWAGSWRRDSGKDSCLEGFVIKIQKI